MDKSKFNWDDYAERDIRSQKVQTAVEELVGYCQTTYPSMYEPNGGLLPIPQLKSIKIKLVEFEKQIRIDFVHQLKIGQRVISMRTYNKGTIIAFRYWNKIKEAWISKGDGVNSDSEDSYDIRWDNGQHSLGCFLGSKVALCQN